MLRWKKLKAKKEALEEASRLPATCSTFSDGSSGDEAPSTTGGSMMLENMPRIVSVCSNATPPSSNSSVSSDGLHIMPPMTRFSDDETTASHGLAVPSHSTNQDSPEESRLAVCTNAKFQASIGQKKRKQDLFLRKVSDSDLSGRADGVRSGSGVVPLAPLQKKARVSPVPLYQPMKLLASPEDTTVLNPLHAFVRNHIEVFTATPTDMAQPAPGRKKPIKLHQVGLRCIHCRGLPSRDRVKRAVCYPSSVGRVYHSVSDMKFDHFGNCRGLSQELRDEFEELKAQCSKRRGGDSKSKGGGSSANGNSSSTAQYYHDSARKMGMRDGGGGIFMAHQQTIESQQSTSPPVRSSELVDDRQRVALTSSTTSPLRTPLPGASKQLSTSVSLQRNMLAMYQQVPQFSAVAFNKPGSKAPPSPVVYPLALPRPSFSRSQSVLLASPLDQQFLNPIHCFVRRNVEVFIATKDDTSAPAPGRKNRVTVGQVGIRCIHCARLPIKDRIKRAICYPPSVSGIYHSVSNMKFDHFGNCRGLPSESRAEFASLKASCNRRSGNGASRGAPRCNMSNSTAQYYHDSALRLGLVDTEMGIRFKEQCIASDMASPASTSVPDGISALMLAATNPRIRAEFDRKRQVSQKVLNFQ